MLNKVELQPAYLLHSRPYRDTSVLLNFYTRDYGRVTALGKGVRRAGSKLKGLLQPFSPLLISFSGKSDLKTLIHTESSGLHIQLQGEFLFSAFYLNELLIKLLHEHEGDQDLFHLYVQTLLLLVSEDDIEPVLRSFELDLLDSLGYGLSFTADAETGAELQQESYYRMEPELGFIQVFEQAEDTFTGNTLVCMAERNFEDAEVKRSAKKLMRVKLNFHLGNKPLKSRRLFV